MHKGYVATSELAEKAGVTSAAFYMLKDVERVTAGNTSLVLVDSLPERFKKFADECMSFDEYESIAELSKILGFYKDSLYMKRRNNTINLPIVKVKRALFVKLSEEYIYYKNKGMIPFCVGENETNEDDAEVIIFMYGLKIGFY